MAPDTARRLGDSQSRTHWNSPKRCRSLSMTDECWDLITKIASYNNINRSEAIERMVREATKSTSLSGVDLPTQVG
jgi:hypothetical protein